MQARYEESESFSGEQHGWSVCAQERGKNLRAFAEDAGRRWIRWHQQEIRWCSGLIVGLIVEDETWRVGTWGVK